MTLETVTVTTKAKKKIELFQEEYVSALFNDINARSFDGINSKEISEASDIFNFLQGRVAGLQVQRESEGTMTIRWEIM